MHLQIFKTNRSPYQLILMLCYHYRYPHIFTRPRIDNWWGILVLRRFQDSVTKNRSCARMTPSEWSQLLVLSHDFMSKTLVIGCRLIACLA